MHHLGKLPGIGPKTAERLTHHLLAASRDDVLALADALHAIKDSIHRCRRCCNLAEGDLCAVCADPHRDPSVVCVVEQPRDLAALERSGTYRGLYHVLHGRLAPLDNIGPEHLTLDVLVRRIASESTSGLSHSEFVKQVLEAGYNVPDLSKQVHRLITGLVIEGVLVREDNEFQGTRQYVPAENGLCCV